MKDIKGYEGEYAVTSCGRIWSYKSKKFLKQRKQRDGYYLVNLCHKGVMKTFQVHTLVAEAYLPKGEDAECVNHKDAIKEHNYAQNLEWCTYSYNMSHSYAIGRNKKGENAMRAVNKKRVKCIETGIVYDSGKEAAEAMGLDPSHISKVCRGKLKSHKGFHFEFVEEENN